MRDRSNIRWASRIALLCAAVPALTGCSESPRPHTLVFEITGRGELSSLSYVINGKETTERSVDVPWEKTVNLPAKDGGHTWSLRTQQGGTGTGSFQVVVYVDDKPIISGSCAGDGCSTDDSGSIRD